MSTARPQGSPETAAAGAPPRAAAEAFLALIALAVLFAVVVGLLVEVEEPAETLVGTLVAQLAGLAAIFFVVRRYEALRGPLGLALGGASLRTAIPLIALAVVAGQAIYLIFDALVGTPEDASGEQFDGESAGTIIAACALLVFLAPVMEEILFRGVIFRALRTGFSFWPAAMIGSILFALIHVPGSGGLEGIGPRLFTGLIFCGLVQRTGTLYPAIAAHAALNAIELGRADIGVAIVFGVLGVGGALLAQHLAPSNPRLPEAGRRASARASLTRSAADLDAHPLRDAG